MKVQIDRELVKQVANCKDKPRNYLFVPGSKQSVLIIDKKAVVSDKVKEAQKKAENNVAHKGLCFHEADQTGQKTLVFLVKKQVPGLDHQLRKCLKENAGLSTQVEVRLPSKEMLDPEGNIIPVIDNTPDTTVVPKEATDAQLDVANKAMYKKVVSYVSGKMGNAIAVDPALAVQVKQSISPLLDQAELLAGDGVPENQRDYKQALKLLVNAKKMVEDATKKLKKPQGREEKVNAVFEAKLKETKAKVQALIARAPNTAASAEANAAYLEAAKKGRLMQFEEATKQLDDIAVPLQQTLQRMDSFNNVYAELMNLTAPSCSPVERAGFDGDMRLALGNSLAGSAKALGAVEDRMRQFLTDRKVFLESAAAVQPLLKEAQQKLPGNARLWKMGYDKTMTEASTIGLGYAYDVMTRIDAKLRQALRSQEASPTGESDNPNVDTESKVADLIGNKSPEVRKMKFKMNVANSRRALIALAGKNPQAAATLEKMLTLLVDMADKNFDDAEQKFESVATQLNAMLKRVQGNLGTQYKDERDKELKEEEAKEKVTRNRFARHRDNAKLPDTTMNWTRDIERRNILTKVVLGKEIGAGGFGKVHLLDRGPNVTEDVPPMIVKLPLDEAGIKEMEREAEIYKKVGDHPNIPKCLGLRDVAGQKGLVLQAVQGRDFDKVSKDLKLKLDKGLITHQEYISTIQFTLTKMLDVFAFMHDKGLAHNDIKGPNVMIDEVTGEPMVIDLGAVNNLGESTSHVDNPIYKAPENVDSKQVSSPQTDAFSAGGVAYHGLNDAPFHFKDQETMQGSWMAKIRQAMEAYSQTGDDEGAIALEDQQNPAQRKVNEFGEEDKDGEHLRKDPSRTAARTKFTDFMNGLMHPDPKKRLTPKEALNHPFLRDRILTDEQVKEVFTGKKDSTSGVVKGNDAKRQAATLNLESNLAKVASIAENVEKMANVELQLKDVPQTRSQIVQFRIDLERIVQRYQTGVRLLDELILNAPDRNSESFLSDNRALESIRKSLADALPLQQRVQILMKEVNDKLRDDVEAQVQEAKAGTLYNAEWIATRKQEIKSRIGSVNNELPSQIEQANELAGNYDKATLLRQFAMQYNAIIEDIEAERVTTAAVFSALKRDPQGAEAAARCAELLQVLEDGKAGIQQATRDIAPALDGFYNNVVAIQAEVDSIAQEAQTLSTRVDTAKANAKTMQEKFAVLSGRVRQAPRTTAEEIAKSDAIKVRFEADSARLRQTLQANIDEVAEQIKSAIVTLQEKQLQLGDAQPPRGFPDVNLPLKATLNVLQAKRDELAKITV